MPSFNPNYDSFEEGKLDYDRPKTVPYNPPKRKKTVSATATNPHVQSDPATVCRKASKDDAAGHH